MVTHIRLRTRRVETVQIPYPPAVVEPIEGRAEIIIDDGTGRKIVGPLDKATHVGARAKVEVHGLEDGTVVCFSPWLSSDTYISVAPVSSGVVR